MTAPSSGCRGCSADWSARHQFSHRPQQPLRITTKQTSSNVPRLSAMNGTLRSKQGCWTCRLRRKKCDEKHPFCSTCESLTITCYGYGSKPDWMDNGEGEKAMANSIKQIVKKTSRHKGRLGIAMGRFQGRSASQTDEGVVKIAPKPTNAGTGHSTAARTDINLPSGESSSPSTLVGTGSAGASPVSCPFRLWLNR